ncbi:MAG: 4-hydroxyphenylacetate 3-hydroxylase family protein [Terriglobales bacterium]
MLRTGKEHLESLRDGRVVYLGRERVADVTAHPAFRNAARSVAMLYDLKHDPAHRDALSYIEEGEPYSMYYLLPRTREDLVRRMRAHKAIAAASYGLMGRSPDHVASFVAGMVLQPEALGVASGGGRVFAENLLTYYNHARRNDIYMAYAVIPPPGARDPAFSGRIYEKSPTLRVIKEDDAGVTISGMKLLATGAVFANEVWVGNVQPVAPDRKKEAITCAVPINAPGLALWSRKPFELQVRSEFDNPLSFRFDESDSVVVFDEVKVPWERVFCHDDAPLSRDIYIKTPSHSFGNHQANVRFWAKLELLIGLASKIAAAGNLDRVPAVRETLGRLAAFEAMLAGMIHGQCFDHEDLGNGYVAFNRRYMYGALSWCTENYGEICEKIRELMGAGVFLMPADASFLEDAGLREIFDVYWRTENCTALDRLKLFRLAWDLLGSEFGARHMQYERFYAGPSFVVHDHSYRECPWPRFQSIVDDLLARYREPREWPPAAEAG